MRWFRIGGLSPFTLTLSISTLAPRHIEGDGLLSPTYRCYMGSGKGLVALAPSTSAVLPGAKI